MLHLHSLQLYVICKEARGVTDCGKGPWLCWNSILPCMSVHRHVKSCLFGQLLLRLFCCVAESIDCLSSAYLYIWINRSDVSFVQQVLKAVSLYICISRLFI